MSLFKEKIVTYSDEAERSFLGCLLLDTRIIQQGLSLLSEEDFFFQENKTVFRGISKVFDSRKDVDLVSVATYLLEEKLLKSIGGAEELAKVMNEVPTSTHFKTYAKIIKHHSVSRKIISLGEKIISISENGKSKELLPVLIDGSKTISADLFKEPKPTMTEMAIAYEEEKAKPRVPSRIKNIDQWTQGGVKRGKFWLLVAGSGVGKTTLALQIMINMMKAGRTVSFYSIEMEKDEVYGYLKRLVGEDFEKDIDEIHYDWNFNFSRKKYLDEILADAIQDRPDVVFIDYLQMIKLRRRTAGIYDRMSEVANTIQGFTRDTGIPVFGLSQISNDEKKSKKGVLLAKGGGELYDSSDVYIGIRRNYEEEQRIKTEEDPAFASGTVQREVHIYKNRQGIEGGFHLDWDYKRGKYVFETTSPKQKPPSLL